MEAVMTYLEALSQHLIGTVENWTKFSIVCVLASSFPNMYQNFCHMSHLAQWECVAIIIIVIIIIIIIIIIHVEWSIFMDILCI
jgi:hypothetical protein